jgi:hypothetical protein
MLIASPEFGNAEQRSGRIEAMLQVATGVGRVVAAASVCREISWPRVKSLTDKFSELLKISVTQREASSAIEQAYDQSAIEGQRTVSSKNTDCAAAVRDLADLERAVASAIEAPPAQVRTTTAVSPGAPTTTGVAQDARQRPNR